METNAIKFFQSTEGKELLSKYSDFKEKELDELVFYLAKKKIPYYPQLTTLLKLRKRAGAKFSLANEMFFDRQSLEAASTEKIGRHIAERFASFSKVADLGCGIGGNALFLAEKTNVLAIERSAERLEMARLNSRAYGVENKIEFVLGDIFEANFDDAEAIFIDPLRSREAKTKTRSIFNSEPNINEILAKIYKFKKNICLKISPAFDYKELLELPDEPELELVSEDGDNKVALLWFGDLKKNRRTATIIAGDSKRDLFLPLQKDLPEISIAKEPLKYIFEPNKAISKSHLVEIAAEQNGLIKLNAKTSFLTGKTSKNVDRDKFKIFKIIQYKPFSWQKMLKDIKKLNPESVSIINRGTPLKPEELSKKLKTKEGPGLFVLLSRLPDGSMYYFLCSRV